MPSRIGPNTPKPAVGSTQETTAPRENAAPNGATGAGAQGSGWQAASDLARRAGANVVSLLPEAVGIAELAGFRYKVHPYQAKVSDGLTRGSRLEHGSDYVALRETGFKGIVDLTAEGTKDKDMAARAGLHPLNLKIRDNNEPTFAQMKEFLDFVTNPANSPAYVHCQAGVGRTGVAVAAYRIAVEGWTAEQALAEGKLFGLKLPNQTLFVKNFAEAVKAGQFAGYPKVATPPQSPVFSTPPEKLDKESLWERVQDSVKGIESNLKLAEALVAGLPERITEKSREFMALKASPSTFKKLSKTDDAHLAAMKDSQLARVAHDLIDAGPLDTVWGADRDARSELAYRLVTAHGTDAAHVHAILGKMPYTHSTLDAMTGPAKLKLERLLHAGRPTPGDWGGFDAYLNVVTNTQARPGTKVEPLIDGTTAFPEMFKAIDGAKSSVNLTVFAFHSDGAGWEMAKRLAAAADRGCQVRVVYDPLGSRQTHDKPTDPGLFKFMKDHGVQVVAQEPGPAGDHLNHRKITVVDGKVGFIGGMNIGDHYMNEWHDVHSRVTGPGVADLQKLFVEQWNADGKVISADDTAKLFPKLEAIESNTARIVGHVGKGDLNLKLAYLRAIDTAKDTINIASPYFADADVVGHLVQAAQRGVKVTFVTPRDNDQHAVQAAGRATYESLVRAGVNVYEYYGKPMAHDKVAVFDGKMMTIGSSNLDARSLGNNDEANVWTNDAAAAAQIEAQLFGRDLANSERITAQKARRFAESDRNQFSYRVRDFL